MRTVALQGITAVPVTVTAERIPNLRGLAISGLSEVAAHEAKYRVTSALRSIGVELPDAVRVTCSPALQIGPGADLPIALAILELLQPEVWPLEHEWALGELALDGRIRPARGALPFALAAAQEGARFIIVAPENRRETSPAGVMCRDPRSLEELREICAGKLLGTPMPTERWPDPVEPKVDAPDLIDVRGNPGAIRALEVAAAGGHSLLLVGPPGSGKTMLARRAAGILPPMTVAERTVAGTVWSAAGLAWNRSVPETRPFRAPHHTVSEAGLLGGRAGPGPVRPGEVSLAHYGVLFLDEVTELRSSVLTALAMALVRGEHWVSTREGDIFLPAAPWLIGAAMPCPCGWRGAPVRVGRTCTCVADRVVTWRARLRTLPFDMAVPFESIGVAEMLQPRAGPTGPTTAEVRARIVAAGPLLDPAQRRGTSVAYTIAALSGRREPNEADVAEALGYTDAARAWQ